MKILLFGRRRAFSGTRTQPHFAFRILLFGVRFRPDRGGRLKDTWERKHGCDFRSDRIILVVLACVGEVFGLHHTRTVPNSVRDHDRLFFPSYHIHYLPNLSGHEFLSRKLNFSQTTIDGRSIYNPYGPQLRANSFRSPEFVCTLHSRHWIQATFKSDFYWPDRRCFSDVHRKVVFLGHWDDQNVVPHFSRGHESEMSIMNLVFQRSELVW